MGVHQSNTFIGSVGVATENIWAIANKEINIFIKKKVIIATLIVPLILAIALPIIIWYGHNSSPVPWSEAIFAFDALVFIFIILAAIIPTVIGSYSIVGEKIEKSLEPLLATPTTDSEDLTWQNVGCIFA